MIFKRQSTKRQPTLNPAKPSYSYYSSSKEQGIDAVRQRQQTNQKRGLMHMVRLLPSMLAVSVILGSIVYSTTLSSAPKVVIKGNAAPYNAPEDYQNYMEQLLRQSFFAKSKLTINTSKLENKFIDHFKEVHAANISLPVIGRRPTLTLTVFQPFILMSTKTRALVVDDNGKAVVEAADLNSSSLQTLLKLQDDSGVDIKPGMQAISLKTVDFIKQSKLQIEANKLAVEHLTLPAKTNELHMKLRDLKYYIKYDVSADPLLQTGSFLAVKTKLEGEKTEPQEYMDVRVEGKVFYK